MSHSPEFLILLGRRDKHVATQQEMIALAEACKRVGDTKGERGYRKQAASAHRLVRKFNVALFSTQEMAD